MGSGKHVQFDRFFLHISPSFPDGIWGFGSKTDNGKCMADLKFNRLWQRVFNGVPRVTPRQPTDRVVFHGIDTSPTSCASSPVFANQFYKFLIR